MQYDCIVIGAGLAGLHTTRLLATRGLRVLCLEPNLIGDIIQVTGLFVQEAFDDVPFPRDFFGPGLSRVTIHAPAGRTITAEHASREFYVADMPALLSWMAAEARQAGAEIRERHRLVDLETTSSGVRLLVQYPGGEPFTFTSRFVLGADGPRSEVAAALDLPRYRRFLHGIEEVYTSDRNDENGGIHLFFGRNLAPGYLAWVIPAPEGYLVGLAGRRRRNWSPARALDEFVARLRPGFGLGKMVSRRGAVIPRAGPRPVLVRERVMLVGDAAGLVSPLTAGGIHYVLQHSRRASFLVASFLESGDRRLFRQPLPPELRRRLTFKRVVRRSYEWFSADWLLDLGMRVLPAVFPTRLIRRAVLGFGVGNHVGWLPVEEGADTREAGREAPAAHTREAGREAPAAERGGAEETPEE